MATYGKHIRVWKESFGDIPIDNCKKRIENE